MLKKCPYKHAVRKPLNFVAKNICGKFCSKSKIASLNILLQATAVRSFCSVTLKYCITLHVIQAAIIQSQYNYPYCHYSFIPPYINILRQNSTEFICCLVFSLECNSRRTGKVTKKNPQKMGENFKSLIIHLTFTEIYSSLCRNHYTLKLSCIIINGAALGFVWVFL